MLESYEIKNFKSFKNRTSFDLKKTNYKTLVDTNTYNDILKGLLFVGPNASGKTNSVKALKFLLDSLFSNEDINMWKYKCLFSDDANMSFLYNFSINNSKIKYCIDFQIVDRIISEKLYENDELLFDRNGSVATINITEKVVHKDVPADTLFLRNVYFNTKFQGNETLQNWFEFLKNSVYIDLYERTTISYNGADVGLIKYLDSKGTNQINDFFSENNFDQYIEYDKSADGKMVKIESDEKMVYYKRKGIDEPIPMELESLGNNTLLHILPPLLYSIKNPGMIIFDEFSSGFHNDLEELIIKYFMKNSTNSQLIIVSHSTNLLSNSLLRPDQIYSVEFNTEGSFINRFSNEKPREAQNLEKMYLSGIFGGIPNYDN